MCVQCFVAPKTVSNVYQQLQFSCLQNFPAFSTVSSSFFATQQSNTYVVSDAYKNSITEYSRRQLDRPQFPFA